MQTFHARPNSKPPTPHLATPAIPHHSTHTDTLSRLMPRPRSVSDAPGPHRDSMFVSPPPTPSAPLPEFQPCIPEVTASTPLTRHLSHPLGESSAAPQLHLARYIAVLQRLSCGVGDRRFRLLDDFPDCCGQRVRKQVSMIPVCTISRTTSGL